VCTYRMLQLYCTCVFVIVWLIYSTSYSHLTNFGSMECNVMYVCMYVDRVSLCNTQLRQAKFHMQYLNESRDSAVGIATGYGLDGRGDRSSSLGRCKIFLLSTSSRPASCPMGTGGVLSPEAKWLGCEADHSPPTSVEVKNAWIYTPTFPQVFMA
jgi:hypothetical protein